MSNNEIVLFESIDQSVKLNVDFDGETVWLTQSQMATLFDTTKQNISLHANNCFREGELEKNTVVKESLTTGADGKQYKTKVYNLDVIISVGYRVKSQRGVEFRRWATEVLRSYIIEGHVENERRLMQLGQIAHLTAHRDSTPGSTRAGTLGTVLFVQKCTKRTVPSVLPVCLRPQRA